jgi:hypothetical protein
VGNLLLGTIKRPSGFATTITANWMESCGPQCIDGSGSFSYAGPCPDPPPQCE